MRLTLDLYIEVKKLWVVVEKVIIVSVHVRYFSFFSFLSLCLTGYVRLRRLHQVTLEGRDVELDNKTETSQ